MSKTVAVIGASSKRHKFGNKALRAYIRQGYTVLPINPNEQQVEGLATSSVLRGPIDMATVYVPGHIGVRVMEDIAKKGIRRSGSARERTTMRSWNGPGPSASRSSRRAASWPSATARTVLTFTFHTRSWRYGYPAPRRAVAAAIERSDEDNCLCIDHRARARPCGVSCPARGSDKAPGASSLFNGKDLTGWKIPEGDGGHWKVVDGVIDYDAGSQAKGDKSLWTEKSFKNFQLKVDWRIKETPFISKNMKIVMPDGRNKRDASGQEINLTAPDSDSGLPPRGSGRAQFNIWCWPVGSGEMWLPDRPEIAAALKAAVTPRMNADNDIGQWNTFELTVQGSDVTLFL